MLLSFKNTLSNTHLVNISNFGNCVDNNDCNTTIGVECLDYVCKCKPGTVIKNSECIFGWFFIRSAWI